MTSEAHRRELLQALADQARGRMHAAAEARDDRRRQAAGGA